MDQLRKLVALKLGTDTQSVLSHDAAMSRRALGGCYEALGVTLSKTAPGADLGGSSKHLHEAIEDRSLRRVSCEQQLDMGLSILKDSGDPHTEALRHILKGNGS